ncbi:hypothetical protein [Rivularia sp. UHCC 0363]|nr:hypothetical protein [Rivularia sp. UHCC 0363]MEA5593932.1 hypothetical protein [Rivularia sp. UHCC 0363]
MLEGYGWSDLFNYLDKERSQYTDKVEKVHGNSEFNFLISSGF